MVRKYQYGYLFKHSPKTLFLLPKALSPHSLLALKFPTVVSELLEVEQAPPFPALCEQGWTRPLVLAPISSTPAVAEGWLFTNTTLTSFCPAPQLKSHGTHRMRPALNQDSQQKRLESSAAQGSKPKGTPKSLPPALGW